MPAVRKILLWIAKQDEVTVLKIMRCKAEWHSELDVEDDAIDATQKELIELCHAAIRCGFGDEAAFKSSKSLSNKAARGISTRRKARAQNYKNHPQKIQTWLAKNLGKIADFRRAGLSWRSISCAVHDEHRIRISHSTLQKYWKKAYEKRENNLI